MSDKQVDGWMNVHSTSTDYEAELVKDRLVDAGIDAVILTHRDSSFSLNVGKMSVVQVLVPPDQEEAARGILDSPPISDADLTDAALRANPILDDQESNDG